MGFSRRSGLVAMLIAISFASLAGPALAVASPRSSTPTRSCGYTRPPGPNIHVRASAGVTCYLAKRMMRMLIDGSKACYPNGYTRTPHCRLWGFRCSAHPIDGGHGSRGRCVKGRKLATGVAHV